MLKMTASEFARNFGRYREAVRFEPVVVTSHGRATAVLVSPREFDECQRLRRLATGALLAEELSAEALTAVAGAGMEDRHAELDLLIDSD